MKAVGDRERSSEIRIKKKKNEEGEKGEASGEVAVSSESHKSG